MTRLAFEIVRPISLNHAWFNTKFGRKLTKEAEAYKEAVGWATKVAAIEQAWEPSSRYQFTLRVWFPDAYRRRDLDNLCKLTLDAVATALGFDDSLVDRIVLERAGIDRHRPRGEVVVEPWIEWPVQEVLL